MCGKQAVRPTGTGTGQAVPCIFLKQCGFKNLKPRRGYVLLGRSPQVSGLISAAALQMIKCDALFKSRLIVQENLQTRGHEHVHSDS